MVNINPQGLMGPSIIVVIICSSIKVVFIKLCSYHKCLESINNLRLDEEFGDHQTMQTNVFIADHFKNSEH